jgi:hypothetical protein
MGLAKHVQRYSTGSGLPASLHHDIQKRLRNQSARSGSHAGRQRVLLCERHTTNSFRQRVRSFQHNHTSKSSVITRKGHFTCFWMQARDGHVRIMLTFRRTRPDIPLSCPTSNCTFAEYETLAVCSRCASIDVSELLTYACLDTTIDWSLQTTGVYRLLDLSATRLFQTVRYAGTSSTQLVTHLCSCPDTY